MKYTKEELEKYVSESKSIASLFRKLKLSVTRSNVSKIKILLGIYGIDISTWSIPFDKRRKLDYDNLNGVNLSSNTLRRLVLYHYKIPYVCKICKCEGMWLDKPITLEIHHKDGDRLNNSKENLVVLCPNCHSQTHTFCKPKSLPATSLRSKTKQHLCECGTLKDRGALSCRECYCKSMRKVARPNKEQLMEDIKTMSMVKVGKKYGVSDNAVRKWVKAYS